MRVLLAGPDFEENLSIRYLASSLKAEGHEPLLAVFNSADDVESVTEEAGETEIVGLSHEGIALVQNTWLQRTGIQSFAAAEAAEDLRKASSLRNLRCRAPE